MRSKLGEHRWEAVEDGERQCIVARIGQSDRMAQRFLPHCGRRMAVEAALFIF
jgi:hypothetical protein